ncbi:MarP family serine protease [Actinoplanes sp. NPDC049681]|uniref:MarP family serine protease n=1 Tax=Actinoplanes sp. NPDC049681 TaxID=3363905 RepID=UPI0037B3C302
MRALDAVLLLPALAVAVLGYRRGLLVAGLCALGAGAGTLLGWQAGPLLATRFSGEPVRLGVSLTTVLVLAALGLLLSVRIGERLKRSLVTRPLRRLDAAGGAFASLGAVLLAAGLVAVWTLDAGGDPVFFAGLVRTSATEVAAPDPALAGAPVVGGSRASVLKVRAAPGAAHRCPRGAVGSGFVYAPERVMTNAHVVAGAGDVRVETGQDQLDATVVVYDPDRDLAVLHVPGLTAPALPFTGGPVRSGADGIVLGYPLDGPYQAQPARIRDLGRVGGRDIYGAGAVTREIYTVRALVRNGNSGGPLVTPGGTVLGVVFGVSDADPDLGFALSAAEVSGTAEDGRNSTEEVGTGACR